MPILDASYVNKQTALQVCASLSNGWTKKKYGHMFEESCSLDFLADHTLRIRLKITSSLLSEMADFPQSLECRGETCGVGYHLACGSLRVSFRLRGDWDELCLNSDLPWILTKAKKKAVYWAEDLAANGLRPLFAAKLWVVLNPPPNSKPADIRDWERKFFPGGLPTLGKHR